VGTATAGVGASQDDPSRAEITDQPEEKGIFAHSAPSARPCHLHPPPETGSAS